MPTRRRVKRGKTPDLLSGLRKLGSGGLLDFERMFEGNKANIKRVSLKPSELNDESKLKWLHNNRVQVTLEGVLENKGSAVLKVGKPKFFPLDEPIPTCPGREALPVTIFTPYTIRLENGKVADKLVALRRYEYKIPVGVAIPQGKALDYIKNFLKELEQKGKIRLPWLDNVKKLNVLFKKLKKEGALPAELIDLNSIKNHKEFLKAVQHYKIREYHKDSLVGNSFHKTIHFNGTVIGKIRKTSLKERLLMKKLGLEPRKYVLEVIETREDPEVSPEEKLKQFKEFVEEPKI